MGRPERYCETGFRYCMALGACDNIRNTDIQILIKDETGQDVVKENDPTVVSLINEEHDQLVAEAQWACGPKDCGIQAMAAALAIRSQASQNVATKLNRGEL